MPLGDRFERPPMDPSVADVEQILEEVASRRQRLVLEERPNARRALWLCACVTFDDAPTWLIYDNAEDGLAWCRVPDGREPLDLVDTQRITGCHTDPGWVLLWLEGEVPDPCGGDCGDLAVVEELGRKIRGS